MQGDCLRLCMINKRRIISTITFQVKPLLLLTTFAFSTGDELGESDGDEMENKRFPQQRFSPVHPVRARSVTPKRGQYFSPIPVSRSLTPDFKTHRKSLPRFSTDTLAKYRSSSALQQTDYSLVTKTKSPPVLQSGPKSAFTSFESKRTATEKDIRSLTKSSNNESVPASLSQSLAPWSRPLTPVKTAFPSKPSAQTHNTADMASSSTEYANRIIPDVSSTDKPSISNTQCGRSMPRFVYTSDAMNVNSFTAQTSSYPQISAGSYVPPFVSFSYPGLHIQDKMMPPLQLSPRPLSSQLTGNPAALLRPNVHPAHSFVNTLLSPVFNIQMQSPITAGHSSTQANVVQNFDVEQSRVDGSKHVVSDTMMKSDKQQPQGSMMLPGTSIRKERELGENKAPAKNILKKFVPDGMEQ